MPDNPYMVGDPSSGGGPSYSRPLLNWQGMAQGIGDAWSQRPQQSGQPGAPMDIRSQLQQRGMMPQGGQPNMGQQGGPLQGLGQRLMAMFGGRLPPQFGGQGGGQFGGPQPPVATPYTGIQAPAPGAQGPIDPGIRPGLY